MSQESEESQFRVSDRRRFTAEGEPRETSEQTTDASPHSSSETEASTTERSEEPQSAEPQREPEPGREQAPLPPASFELLVVSLAMQAQMELGLQSAPEGQTPNLDLARHTIDLLAVLKEKTKGNLEVAESLLLENTLTELRFRYVHCVNEINKQAKG